MPETRPPGVARAPLFALADPIRRAVAETAAARDWARVVRCADPIEADQLDRVNEALDAAAKHLQTALRETGPLPRALRAMTEGGDDGGE